jgi:hypothetical protein
MHFWTAKAAIYLDSAPTDVPDTAAEALPDVIVTKLQSPTASGENRVENRGRWYLNCYLHFVDNVGFERHTRG